MAQELEPVKNLDTPEDMNQKIDELGLPPRPKRCPTEDELRALAKLEEDPREILRRLRQRMPFASGEALNMIIR